MEALKMIPGAILGLVVAGLIVTAGLKAMGNMKESNCPYTFDAADSLCLTCPTTGNCSTCTVNKSSNTCYNSSLGTADNAIIVATAELNATYDASDGTQEVAKQFPTIGIIIAMVIILMLIGSLSAYFAFR